MENLSPEKVQSLCRACLKELKERQKYKIFRLNLQIRQWLEDATIDNPLAHDRYPNSICYSCKNKLKEFLEFHEMCKQSRKTLHKILRNDNEIEEILKTNDNEENKITKTETNLFILDIKESLISSDNISPNNTNKTSNCLDLNSDIEELEQHNNSSDNDLIDSDELPTDSESDNQNEKNTTNLKKKNNLANKKETNLSNGKGKRKKYSYLFRCDQCKYRCVSQQTLNIHLRTHYGLKPYQCPKCDEAFEKSNILLKHLNEIHGEKELIIICEHEECGKNFTSTRSYKDHYRQNHIPQQLNQKQDKSATKTPYKHICEECGKIYTKLQTFKEHQYTHGPKELYPFQCDECDKAFVKQRTFNEHKLRHAGIKNFECPHCGAKKTTKKELRSHMNSHTRERQYPCPNCPMIFYRSSNRRIHVDVVHQGIRRFACRFCDQTFGKGDNLKNHELLHTGEKPHACTECGKRFVQRVSLRSHMKTHNK